MKVLNGSELASYIKQRQLKQVRSLVQAHGVQPHLAILQVIDDPVIDTYVRLKKAYGADIGVEVAVHRVQQTEVRELLGSLNADEKVHGIIVQLPLEDPTQTDELLAQVSPQKDVDGLHTQTEFTAATAQAISWLLEGYNIDLRGKHVVILGKGRLVGSPLARLFEQQGYDSVSFDEQDGDVSEELATADVIVTATGVPAIVKSENIKEKAVVVDAGVATDGKQTVGDLDSNVYERDDLTITPKKGGVGPLTVSALFENVLRAAGRDLF